MLFFHKLLLFVKIPSKNGNKDKIYGFSHKKLTKNYDLSKSMQILLHEDRYE